MKIETVEETLLTRYAVRKELVHIDEEKPVEMETAYTFDGHYIGPPEMARQICDRKKIVPEPIPSQKNMYGRPGCKVCSIGYCKKDKKWYGWSHRAIYGFGIGSKVAKGDIAYVSNDPDEIEASLTAMFPEQFYKDLEFAHTETGVLITFEANMCNAREVEGEDGAVYLEPFGEQTWEPREEFYEYGMGEWVAKTLDDAKQMAIDFARGVA